MNKKLYIAAMMVFVLILGMSTFFIARHYMDSREQRRLYDGLAKTLDESRKISGDELSDSDGLFLPGYEELYRENSDMVGWIKIDGTNIDYPVMQSVDEPNFYLKHSFYREYTDYGCPYVQENCNVVRPSDNLIIYGHHMNGKAMFGGLSKYKSKEFWKEHQTIAFDTLDKHNEYQIIAVFKTVAYTNRPEDFKYHHFVDAESKDEFAAYVERCKELSLYDTGISAEYGDKLITLSTCEYSQRNGRLVVVAKLMK